MNKKDNYNDNDNENDNHNYNDNDNYNDNYNIEYLCKYKNEFEINKFKELMITENNDIDIEIDIESELYRLDILNIFQMDNYKDNTIMSTIDEIYECFINKNENPQIMKFKKILNKSSQLFMSSDERFGLTVLFSYEYLNIAHKCICEIIKTNNINENTLSILEKHF